METLVLWFALGSPAVIFLLAARALVVRLRLESHSIRVQATVTSHKQWTVPGCTCARRPPRPGRARTGCAGRIVHQCRAEHVRPGTQVEFAMDRGLGVRRGRRDPDVGDVVPVQDRRHRPVGAEHRIAHRRLGGRLHVLRKIAGHGSLSTTQRYLHPDRQSIADAGEKLSSHLRAQAEELAEVSGDGPASCEQSRPAM